MSSGRTRPWLEDRAAALGGNLSAALRQAITDARLLESAREDYKLIRTEHPEWEIPHHDDDGTSRAVDVILGLRITETEDLELRKEEANGEG
jgi:hypothetical protein